MKRTTPILMLVLMLLLTAWMMPATADAADPLRRPEDDDDLRDGESYRERQRPVRL